MTSHENKPRRLCPTCGHEKASDPKVVTVTSATGGCGKTFYATNLAAWIAHSTGQRVLLVDLDLQFGEVSVSLRLKPVATITDVLEGMSLPDAVMNHKAGFDVLCAPTDPVQADRIGAKEASAVLAMAREHYDHVVVDTPPALNEIVLSAFDVSEQLVVMATMDVPSLKNLSVFRHTLKKLKVRGEATFVLNKAEKGTGLSIADVRKVHPFSTVLPYAREVSRSLNVGMPVIVSDPSAEVSRKLVEGLGGTPDEPAKKWFRPRRPFAKSAAIRGASIARRSA